MNDINTVLAIAKEQAGNIYAPPAANDPARSLSVASLTMDDVASGSMINDEWLKVKPFGLLIGASTSLITDGLLVEMNLSRNTACYCIKAGNPALYKKTYGGGLCVDGGRWREAIREVKAIDPKAEVYPSADILMTVLKTNGEAREGMVLGHSLSTTNWKPYLKFYMECRNKGLKDQDIRVKVSHKRQSNKAGNEWGTLAFEISQS